MLKRILIILVAVFVVFAMLGCDNGGGGGGSSGGGGGGGGGGDKPPAEPIGKLELLANKPYIEDVAEEDRPYGNYLLDDNKDDVKPKYTIGNTVTLTYNITSDVAGTLQLLYVDQSGDRDLTGDTTGQGKWWYALSQYDDIILKKDKVAKGKIVFKMIADAPNEKGSANSFVLTLTPPDPSSVKADTKATITLYEWSLDRK